MTMKLNFLILQLLTLIALHTTLTLQTGVDQQSTLQKESQNPQQRNSQDNTPTHDDLMRSIMNAVDKRRGAIGSVTSDSENEESDHSGWSSAEEDVIDSPPASGKKTGIKPKKTPTPKPNNVQVSPGTIPPPPPEPKNNTSRPVLRNNTPLAVATPETKNNEQETPEAHAMDEEERTRTRLEVILYETEYKNELGRLNVYPLYFVYKNDFLVKTERDRQMIKNAVLLLQNQVRYNVAQLNASEADLNKNQPPLDIPLDRIPTRSKNAYSDASKKAKQRREAWTRAFNTIKGNLGQFTTLSNKIVEAIVKNQDFKKPIYDLFDFVGIDLNHINQRGRNGKYLSLTDEGLFNRVKENLRFPEYNRDLIALNNANDSVEMIIEEGNIKLSTTNDQESKKPIIPVIPEDNYNHPLDYVLNRTKYSTQFGEFNTYPIYYAYKFVDPYKSEGETKAFIRSVEQLQNQIKSNREQIDNDEKEINEKLEHDDFKGNYKIPETTRVDYERHKAILKENLEKYNITKKGVKDNLERLMALTNNLLEKINKKEPFHEAVYALFNFLEIDLNKEKQTNLLGHLVDITDGFLSCYIRNAIGCIAYGKSHSDVLHTCISVKHVASKFRPESLKTPKAETTQNNQAKENQAATQDKQAKDKQIPTQDNQVENAPVAPTEPEDDSESLRDVYYNTLYMNEFGRFNTYPIYYAYKHPNLCKTNEEINVLSNAIEVLYKQIQYNDSRLTEMSSLLHGTLVNTGYINDSLPNDIQKQVDNLNLDMKNKLERWKQSHIKLQTNLDKFKKYLTYISNGIGGKQDFHPRVYEMFEFLGIDLNKERLDNNGKVVNLTEDYLITRIRNHFDFNGYNKSFSDLNDANLNLTLLISKYDLPPSQNPKETEASKQSEAPKPNNVPVTDVERDASDAEETEGPQDIGSTNNATYRDVSQEGETRRETFENPGEETSTNIRGQDNKNDKYEEAEEAAAAKVEDNNESRRNNTGRRDRKTRVTKKTKKKDGKVDSGWSILVSHNLLLLGLVSLLLS